LTYQTQGDAEKIWFTVAPKSAGFLYILNYGAEADGKPSFRLLYPLSSGTAERPVGQALRIPEKGWYGPNTASDKNYPYFVWSAAAIPEMESLKLLRQDHGNAVVDSEAKIAEIQAFLKQHQSEASSNAGVTEARTTDKILVHAISLERR